jgi:hypothetical protein
MLFRPKGQNGQSAVETALTLPFFVFLFAGILQMTMLHHAQLMVEYAAYQAARSGIVWDGDKDHMEHAACMALTPTLAGGIYGSLQNGRAIPIAGKADSLDKFIPLYVFACGADRVGKVASESGFAKQLGLTALEFIRVDVLNPDPKSTPSWAQDGELEFDDLAGVRDVADTHVTTQGQADSDDQRHSNLLTVRVRYFYPMHIPFANWIIQTAWMASHFGLATSGGIDNVRAGSDHGITTKTGVKADLAVVPYLGDIKLNDQPLSGLSSPPIATRSDLLFLWGLARAGRLYAVPLTATYTMRMQSNFYLGGN